MSEDQILAWFDYHEPTPEQTARIERVRAACKEAAITIMHEADSSADRTVALRHLGEASMNAVRAIVTESPPREMRASGPPPTEG